jgi:hypothetical protein
MLAFLTINFAISGILLLLSSLGELRMLKNSNSVRVYPFISVAGLILLIYLSGFPSSTIFRQIIEYLFLILIFFALCINTHQNLKKVIKQFAEFLCFAFIATLPFLPLYVSYIWGQSLLPFASIGNNDLGVYAIATRQFDSHNLYGPSYLANGTGSTYSIAYFGFTELAQLSMTWLRLSPSHSVFFVLLLSQTLLVMATYELISKLMPQLTKRRSVVVLLFTILSPLNAYVLLNNFGGQILAIAGLVLFFSKLIYTDEKRWPSKPDFVIIAASLVIMGYTYAPVLMLACILLFVTSLTKLAPRILKDISFSQFADFYPVILGFLLITPVIKLQIHALVFLSQVKAGWPLDPSKYLYGWNLYSSKHLVLLILLLTSIGVCLRFLTVNKNSSFSKWKLLGAFWILVVFLVYMRWKFHTITDYHVWKAISYSLIILSIIFIGMIFTILNNEYGYRIVTGLLIIGVVTSVATDFSYWRGVLQNSSLVLNPDVSILSKNSTLNHLQSINIRLALGNESSVAASEVRTKNIFLNQITTTGLFHQTLEDRSTCTLTRTSYLPSDYTGSVIHLDKTLILIPYPHGCSKLARSW